MNPPALGRWRVVGLLMALCAVSHFNRVAMSIAADERIMQQHGISPKQMGLVYSAFLLVYTLAMVPGGWFIDRVGPRRALVVMGLGSAVFGALTGLLGLGLAPAGNLLLALILVRGTMGLFTTPLHPGSARLLAQSVPPGRLSLANGFVTCAAVAGVAATYSVFGALIDRFDWPVAFVFSAAATALVTLALALLVADSPGGAPHADDPESPPDSARATDFAMPLFSRSLALLTLSYAAIGYFQYLFFYWIHYYFKEVLQLGPERSRLYAGLPTLALALGMVLGGGLADAAQRRLPGRIGRRLVPAAGMFAGTVFVLAGIFAREPGWIVAFFMLAMAGIGASESSFWQTAVELGGDRGGTAAAIMNTSGNGVGLLAPLLTPFISEALGWRWGIGVAGVVSLAGAACWWGIDPRKAGRNSPTAAH